MSMPLEVLEDDIGQRPHLVKLLHDVMLIANASRSVSQALQGTLERLCREFDWSLGHIFVAREDGLMEFASGIRRLETPGYEELLFVTRGARYRPGTGWVGQVASEGKPLSVPDLEQAEDRGDEPRRRWVLDLGLKGLFVYPIIEDRKVLAVMEFFSFQPFQATADLLDVMALVSAQLGCRATGQGIADERRRARRLTETTERTRRDFLAKVSHRIRTPMNAVIGMTDLLLHTSLSAQQRELAETVRSSGAAVLTIIEDVLDFLNLEWGALELLHQPFSLRDSIAEAIDRVAPWTAEKGLHLSYRVAASVPDTLVTDAARLQLILVNLLRNAVEFSPRGEIVLTVAAAESRSEDHAVPERHRIEFAIRDTGTGIAPDRLDQLFQPFNQIDVPAAREHGATGLGLAISRKLCLLLGGDLQAESELGRGSIFRFTIEVETLGDQAALWTRAAEKLTVAEPAVSTRPLEVLIAEDNLVNQRVAVKMVEALDHKAEVAENGLRALAALEGRRFDVVLMDVEMPELDGFEATRRIRREWPADRQPYIIALTARVMPGDREQCLEAGMDDYISKPVTLEGLSRAFARFSRACSGPKTRSGSPPAP